MKNASEALLVGIDVGTSHIRALIFSQQGHVVASGRSPMPIESSPSGRAEFDAESLWQGTRTALQEAIAGVETPQNIQAVAVASIGESGIALDACGQSVAPSLAWYERSPAQEAQFLSEKFGLALSFRNGMRLHPIAGLCKILWLQQQNPHAFGRLHHWLNVADFIAWKLSGEMATDYTLASRMLTLDIQNQCWAEDLLKELHISPQIFAPLAPNGHPLGNVTPQASKATGLPTHCTVTTGGHDHIIGALPTGAFQPGVLLDSIGTAEALMLTLATPPQDETLVRFGFDHGVICVEDPMYFLMGGLMTSGAAMEWFRSKVVGEGGYEGLIQGAEAIPPGSGGVCFVPHLRMASQPENDPRARGAFLGLNPEADQATLFRAVLEGMALDVHNIVNSLDGLQGVPAVQRIHVTGGGSQNRLLLEIKAAVFNQTLHVIDLPDAVSLAAACLAGIGGGVFNNLEEALGAVARPFEEIVPEKRWSGIYQKIYETQFLPALHALKPLWDNASG